VTQQRDGLVAQQREPMLGDAAQFAMTYVVSHLFNQCSMLNAECPMANDALSIEH
jgi:hypothetical protein